MEKIVISLVLIALNVGLYLIFLFKDQLNIPKKVGIGFFAFFLIVSIIWATSKNPNFSRVPNPIFLLGIYLLGFLVIRFFFNLRFFKEKNITVHKLIKQFFKFILLPTYTLFVTTGQLLLLYNVI